MFGIKVKKKKKANKGLVLANKGALGKALKVNMLLYADQKAVKVTYLQIGRLWLSE